MGFIQTSQVCRRLRSAADQVYQSWPAMQWQKVLGSTSEIVTQRGREPFEGLVFESGQDLVLHTHLHLPETVAGVSLAGDALELTISSLYPMELFWNETPLFSESHVPVAAGPALVRVLPRLQAGDNGALSAHIHIPPNQTSPWFQRFQLFFTTPRLRARFELFDIAWAQLALADFLAQAPEERELVRQAALLVPEESLLTACEETLQAAFQHMEERLAPLAQRAAGLQVHLIGHCHIDMNWLWTWQDTVEVIKRDFKSVLALMEAYPELTFTHSQPVTYEVLRQQEPELFAQVKEHIRHGRWEAATLAWLEGDTNMASGEATARQLLEGVWFAREELETRPSTMLAPDTFGHAGNLPQLALSAGAQRYYHHRANPGQADLWPAYWWEGQDGSRLLAVSTLSYNGEITARALVEAAMLASRHGFAHSVHFHGVGDHGGGPASQNLEALRRLQQHSLLPSAACSTLERYSTAILASGTELPVHHGESSTIFEGCYTTHADTKRFNRSAENLLCTADTLAVLVQQDYTAELQTAWRAVLFNQFHDILGGSAIHESYKKNAEDYAEVASTAHTVIDHALRLLEQGQFPGSIAVTNPLGWMREDWAYIPGWQGQDLVWLSNEQGHRTTGQPTPQGLGFVARVPAFGTVTYQVEQTQEAFSSALQIEASFAPLDERQQTNMIDSSTCPYLRIETPHFRVYLRRDSGILVSFFDKRVDRELVSYGLRKGSDYLDSARADLALNVFQVIEEHPHALSAWHLDEVHTEHSLLRGATSEVIEVGPARLVVEVQRQFRSSRITQQICFYRDLARVDFQTVLDWQEPGNDQVGIPNLKVAFTARLPECQPWFEIPFAAVQRPSDGQEVPALRWADVGGASYGFALINESKYGYDALGNRLRLTLVRSAYEPDSHADLGSHEFRYCFLPHPGDWRTASVVQTAAGFNQPLLAREVNAGPDSRAVLQPGWQLELVPATSSVLLSGLKAAHDRSGTIIRLYESAGQSAQITLHGLPERGRIWETTIVEDRLELLDQQDGVLSLAFQPWQVRTLLLENAQEDRTHF